MMLRKLRALGVAAGGACSRVRHGHSATQMSPAEKQRLLQELQAVASDDAAAAQRVAALMSASTAQNLARALVVVRHEQKQQLKPSGATEPPVTISMQELKYVALQQGLPFIGFGFVDNAIMIIAGDYIDVKLGVSLGISSMAAAGIGNTISDIAGLGLGGVVEDFCTRLGLPTPSLTPEQMMLKETRVAKTVGSSIGVTIGCLLGMLPLLFMETRSSHSEPPKEAHYVVTTA